MILCECTQDKSMKQESQNTLGKKLIVNLQSILEVLTAEDILSISHTPS